MEDWWIEDEMCNAVDAGSFRSMDDPECRAYAERGWERECERENETFTDWVLRWLKEWFKGTPGHWEERQFTKAEVFRNMKHWERRARAAEFNRFHPAIIEHDQERATYWKDLLEEMQLLGTDTIKGKDWVLDAR